MLENYGTVYWEPIGNVYIYITYKYVILYLYNILKYVIFIYKYILYYI